MQTPESIRETLQAVVDAIDGTWTVAHYVAVVGMQRVADDGSIETRVMIAQPDGQPDYVAEGLLSAGWDVCQSCGDDDDDL